MIQLGLENIMVRDMDDKKVLWRAEIAMTINNKTKIASMIIGIWNTKSEHQNRKYRGLYGRFNIGRGHGGGILDIIY